MWAIYSLQSGPIQVRHDTAVPGALLFKSYLPGAIFDHNNGIDKTVPLMQNAWGRISLFFCSATSRRDGTAVVILKPANFEDVNVEENVRLPSRRPFREYMHASWVKGNTCLLLALWNYQKREHLLRLEKIEELNYYFAKFREVKLVYYSAALHS